MKPNQLQHPDLDMAQRFVDHTSQHGGATMNVHTGELLQPGKRGYLVGAAKGVDGNPVPTGRLKSIDAQAALQEIHRVRSSGVQHIGSWKNPETHEIETDAAEVHSNKRSAIRTAKQRGELAIWDNKSGTSIDVKNRSQFKR